MRNVPVGFIPRSRGTQFLAAYRRDVNVVLNVTGICVRGIGRGKEGQSGVNFSGLKGGGEHLKGGKGPRSR